MKKIHEKLGQNMAEWDKLRYNLSSVATVIVVSIQIMDSAKRVPKILMRGVFNKYPNEKKDARHCKIAMTQRKSSLT